LFAYSLGLGLPFILIGLGVRRLTGALRYVRRNYHWFAGVGGVMLITIGILVATNLWTVLLSRLGVLRLVQGFEPPL
jgi:cytochrome c-type biogenesis protein